MTSTIEETCYGCEIVGNIRAQRDLEEWNRGKRLFRISLIITQRSTISSSKLLLIGSILNLTSFPFANSFGLSHVANLPSASFSMVTACIVLLYISYAIPVICLLIRGRNNIRHGPFWMGSIGLLSNIVLLMWTAFTLIMYSFPSVRPVLPGSKFRPFFPLLIQASPQGL